MNGTKAWITSFRALSRRTGPQAIPGASIPSVMFAKSAGIFLQISDYTDILAKGIAITDAARFYETPDGGKHLAEQSQTIFIPKGNMVYLPAASCVHLIGYDHLAGVQAHPRVFLPQAIS